MEIQKVGDISHKQFMEEFYLPGKPCVFKSASKVWKANGTFTPNWFRKHYPDVPTEVKGKTYTMSQIMDMVENSTEASPAPYPCVYHIPTQLPALMDMLKPLNMNYAVPNWLEHSWFQRGYWGSATEMFIGGPGGKFPYLHLDYYHLNAWINQLYGDKQFIVFPKGQEDMLYPKPDDPWHSELDIFNPDFTKYPKYKDATPIKFVVHAGESLFIPAGTWHTAYSLSPTISVAFDQLNEKNFKAFLKDVWVFKRREGLAKAIGAYTYAWMGGIVCNK
ncbi:MAG: cupin-like domain-containing protein [Chitinophagia bacterium]|nr:cupin-like domain-containing protein [Chitinophagia bacterium]